MAGRTRAAIVACIAGLVTLAAMALWLASRPDTVLAHWSAVAGVIAAVVAILTLVATLIPLWRRNNSGDTADREEPRPPRANVTQNIRSKGSVNVVGEGSQINVDLGLPPREPKDGR